MVWQAATARLRQGLETGLPFFISFRNPRRKDFTRSCGKRTPKGCAVPLVVYKGLMRREAPKLGLVSVGSASRAWGWDCPASGSPVRLLPFSRPAGVGRGRAHAGRIVCKGWGGRGWPPCVSPLPSFQVARNFPPCAARVFLPIFCARERKQNAISRPLKKGLYMAYI